MGMFLTGCNFLSNVHSDISEKQTQACRNHKANCLSYKFHSTIYFRQTIQPDGVIKKRGYDAGRAQEKETGRVIVRGR